jgi:hypothetical protein
MRFLARDDCALTLFLVVLRELALTELNAGPEVLLDVLVDVLLVLPRALLTVLLAVFVALLTLRLRDSGLLLLEPDDRFLPALDRVLGDVALFLRMLADLAPLDTLAVLASLLPRLPRPPLVFTAASSLSNSLAPSLAT